MQQNPALTAAIHHPLGGQRRPWLVISNCQAMGLANSLSLLSDEISIEYHDPTSFALNKNAILDQVDTYDRILIAPWAEREVEAGFADRANVWRVPVFNFTGYHPDLFYLATRGGLMGGHDSIIAFAAYRSGLSSKQTMRLYREDVYAAMGYLDHWDQARVALVDRYGNAGFDIAQAFVDWSRTGPFTYIPAHPKIRCLRDIARSILARAELTITRTDLLPHETMPNGAIFPVYPEIGARIGVQGDYLFKLPGKYQMIDLPEFIEGRQDFYRSCSDMLPQTGFQPAIDRAMSVIENFR